MPVKLNSTGGGSVTLDVPSTASAFTATLPAGTGTIVVAGSASALTSGTANTVSGTSVDYTGIPSWVKRITVMFNGVSTSGTSNYLIQIGSGSFTSSGYNAYGMIFGSAGGSGSGYTTGFGLRIARAAAVCSGIMTLTNLSGNVWAQQHSLGDATNTEGYLGSGSVTLSGTLDRIRVTTVNGTDTFDAGTINILYE